MQRADVERNFRLEDEAGDMVSGQFFWTDGPLVQPQDNESDNYYDYKYDEGDGPTTVGVETVSFRPDDPLAFGGTYQVYLPAGAEAKVNEDAVTADEFSSEFMVVPFPIIEEIQPHDGEEFVNPWRTVDVTFSAPMKPDSLVLGESLFIDPPITATEVYSYWWYNNTELEISFPTEPSSTYSVTLGAGLESRHGQVITEPTSSQWETRATNPLIYLHSPGRVAMYNAYTDTLAYVTVRNLSRIQFQLYAISRYTFTQIVDDWSAWENFHLNKKQALATWTLETNPPLNKNRIYQVDLGQESGLGDPLPPGLYYLEVSASAEDLYPEAQGAEFYNSLERQIIAVSRHNIILKSSATELLGWLTNLKSGQPVADVPLNFYIESSRLLKPINTDTDGLGMVEHARKTSSYTPRYIFAGGVDFNSTDFMPDFAVASSRWNTGISVSYF